MQTTACNRYAAAAFGDSRPPADPVCFSAEASVRLTAAHDDRIAGIGERNKEPDDEIKLLRKLSAGVVGHRKAERAASTGNCED
ncbi:MAG: hypothetical protein OXC26_15785 [Albidovulum sp.]|nr:hypothetical protein [Albidovulum sp.]